MPGPVDLGDYAGAAAPGGTSPVAILTTRGDVLVVDSTGKPVRLAKGSAGQVLGWNATDAVAVTPPGRRLLTHVAYSALTNPTSATSLLGGASTNLWPAFVTAGDMVRVQFGGHTTGGTSTTFTLTALDGATTVATLATTTNLGASTRGFSGDLWFKFDTSTSVRPYGWSMIRGIATTTGYQALVTVGDLLFGDGTPVAVSAGPQDFDLKAVFGTSNGSNSVTLESLDVWHYPV